MKGKENQKDVYIFIFFFCFEKLIFFIFFISLPFAYFVTTHKHRLFYSSFCSHPLQFFHCYKNHVFCLWSFLLVLFGKLIVSFFVITSSALLLSAHSLTSLTSNLQTIHFHLLLFCPFPFFLGPSPFQTPKALFISEHLILVFSILIPKPKIVSLKS